MGETEGASGDGVHIAGYASRDELLSVRVQTGAKRLFAALCENERGRFLKLSDGRGKILVPANGIPQLRRALVALEAALRAAPPLAPLPGEEGARSEVVDAQRFLSEGRKFYLDVLENSRGRYLKISQSSTRRVTMILPVAGLALLREGVDMLLDKAPPDTKEAEPGAVHRLTRTVERVTPMLDGASVTLNVVQREIRVLGKRVIFESGANRRGSYIKIMENNGSQRMAVMLPHAAVPDMIQLLQEVLDAGDPADAIASARSSES